MSGCSCADSKSRPRMFFQCELKCLSSENHLSSGCVPAWNCVITTLLCAIPKASPLTDIYLMCLFVIRITQQAVNGFPRNPEQRGISSRRINRLFLSSYHVLFFHHIIETYNFNFHRQLNQKVTHKLNVVRLLKIVIKRIKMASIRTTLFCWAKSLFLCREIFGICCDLYEEVLAFGKRKKRNSLA